MTKDKAEMVKKVLERGGVHVRECGRFSCDVTLWLTPTKLLCLSGINWWVEEQFNDRSIIKVPLTMMDCNPEMNEDEE